MLNNLSIVVVLYSLFSSKAMSLGEKIADFDKTEPNQGLNIFGGLYILRYAIESLSGSFRHFELDRHGSLEN